MPALSHTTKVYAIKTMKIYKVTADIQGSATAYGTGIQVVGMRSVAVVETWKEAILRGDNQILDYEAMRETVKMTFRHGKLNADVVGILTGSTVVDSGVTPNRLVTNTYAGSDLPAFWKFDAECFAVDGTGGDYHLLAGKCKIAGSRPFGMVEEGFQEFQFEAMTIPPVGSGSIWYQETVNETAVAPA